MRATDGDEVVFPIDGEVDEGVEVLWPLPESLPELIAQAAAKKNPGERTCSIRISSLMSKSLQHIPPLSERLDGLTTGDRGVPKTTLIFPFRST